MILCLNNCKSKLSTRRARDWKLNIKKTDIYFYHLAKQNKQSNENWLKTMFYFLIQQIIRQSFKYWALYACLGFDRNMRLIFYSYYAKYVKLENVIYFEHININVLNYLTITHDKNIIQEFFSLNDKTIVNCIEFVSKSHHSMVDWWI